MMAKIESDVSQAKTLIKAGQKDKAIYITTHNINVILSSSELSIKLNLYHLPLCKITDCLETLKWNWIGNWVDFIDYWCFPLDLLLFSLQAFYFKQT